MKDEEEMKGEGGRKTRGMGWGRAREGREKEEEAGGHTLAPLFPSCCPRRGACAAAPRVWALGYPLWVT